MSRLNRLFVRVAALAALGVTATGVEAQTRVFIEPSWFLSNASGTVNYGGAPIDVDPGIGSGSISSSLDGRVEVDFGDWAVHVGASFQDVRQSGSVEIEDVGTATGTSDYEVFMLEAVVFRSIAGQPEGLEAYGGLRLGAVDSKLEWSVPEPLESGAIEKDEGWVSPLIGLKVSSSGDGALFGSLRGDIGGFGIGASLMLNGVAKGGYRLTRAISLEAGLRYIAVDYEKGNAGTPAGFRYDVSNFGFLLGFGIATG